MPLSPVAEEATTVAQSPPSVTTTISVDLIEQLESTNLFTSDDLPAQHSILSEDAITIIQTLLKAHHESSSYHSNLSSHISSLELEVKQLSRNLSSVTDEKDRERNHASDLQNKLHSSLTKHSKDSKAFAAERKKLETKITKLTNVESSFKAALRKQEVGYLKLQKQLQNTLRNSSGRSMKTTGKWNDTRVLNTNDAVKDACSSHDLIKEDNNDVSALVIASYEARELELVDQNDKLYAELAEFRSELKQLRNEYRSAIRLMCAKQNNTTFEEEERCVISDTNLNVGNLRAAMADLATKIQNLETSTNVEVYNDDDLKQDQRCSSKLLMQAKEIIYAQEKLIKVSLEANVDKEHPPSKGTMNLSYLDMIAEDLENDRNAMNAKQQHLDEEREMLLTQAQKLDTDRVAFEMKKQDEFFSPISPIKQDSDAVPSTPATKTLLKNIGIL